MVMIRLVSPLLYGAIILCVGNAAVAVGTLVVGFAVPNPTSNFVSLFVSGGVRRPLRSPWEPDSSPRPSERNGSGFPA